MRVILNGVSALKPKTGVGHTTVNLHRALVDASRGDAFWLYPGSAVSAVASRMLKGKKKPASKSGGARPARVKSVAIEAAKAAYRESFRVAARWGRFDLYHEPNFIPIRTHLPTVVTVHDLSVVLHPEWHPADRVRFHERHFHAGIAAAEHVIVVSHAVRREMIEHLNFDPRRVSAIHNGIGSHYVPQPAEAVEAMRSRLGLPPRYFLTVGTIEPRKNLLTVMKAFCELPSDVRAACPLVLAGGWGWKSGPERELFEREAWPRGAIHLGYVADADLPALYSGAAALMYPSFYEGFGLPVAEMLACGGAVVASSADAVREVAGRHAPIVEPLDVDGWRTAMLRTAREPEWLEEHRRGAIRHAQTFTWHRAAADTLQVYRRVLGEGVTPMASRRAA
ncbi:MAG: glycosyltransferase family 1 protein [Gemmataceae bacterium]